MKRIQIYLTMVIVLCAQLLAQAQLSSQGEPRGRNLTQKKSANYIEMPDADAFRTSTTSQNHKKRDLIGRTFPVDITPYDAGEWFQLPGGRLWKIAFHSTNAAKIGVSFSQFLLTPGCEVYTYSDQHDDYRGAFTSARRSNLRKLTVDPILGNTLIVELWQPDGAEMPQLTIGSIDHMYPKSTSKKGSDFCHININCDEGLDWQKEKRSVVRFTVKQSGAMYACTGALINNTAKNGKPYLLTANHCIDSQEQSETALFYFNNEQLTCEGNEIHSNQSLSGAYFCSTAPDAKLDFCLVELSQIPPANFEPYYAGWDRTGNIPQRSTTIHHPNGDIKKITKDNDPATENGKSPFDWPDDDNSHFAVLWDIASTEHGTSGAPVFNESHLYYGDLVGGDASCSSPFLKDLVTKFSLMWNKYPEQAYSVHKWLDPLNTGAMQLPAFDPNIKLVDVAIDEIVYPKGAIRANQTISPQISISNSGTQTLTAFSVSLHLNGLLLATKSWTGTLLPNAYTYIDFEPIFSFGEGLLEATVTLPTTLTDEYFSNNSATVTITHADGVDIVFDLVSFPDNKSIGWELLDEWENTLYQHSYAAKQQQYTYPFVLTPGCYTIQTTRSSYAESQPYTIRNTTEGIYLSSGEINPEQKTISFCTSTEGPGSMPRIFYRIRNFSSGHMRCEILNTDPANIQLIDLSGRTLASWTNVLGDHNFDLPNLQTAVYILRITSGEQTAQERIFYQQR